MKKTFLLFAASIATASFNQVAAQITSLAPYCAATFDDDPFPVDDAINSVSFGTLSNVTNAQYAAPHYVYYNNITAPTVVKGSSYTLTVKFDVKGGAGYGVWIDYNRNNVFEPSERISGTGKDTSLDITTSTTITKSVTIPTTATNGITRMRVRIVEDDNYTMGTNGYAIPACNASTSAIDVMDWGETEDYNINITSPVGISERSTTASTTAIYPNPATNTLHIAAEMANASSYKIFNLMGQQVMSGSISQQQIAIAQLATGSYLVQLFANTQEAIGQQTFIKTAE